MIAILLSGGIGSRMKTEGMPKQYLPLCGRPILLYSLQTFDRHPAIMGAVIVADVAWRDLITAWMEQNGITKFVAFADPGETRQYSIFNGLRKVAECCENADAVIIHDAARPLISAELISKCLAALPGHDGVMPVLPAKDTFYLTDGHGKVTQLLNRSALAAGQAPEAFVFRKYYAAHLQMSREALLKINGSTEIAVLNGFDIVTVEGDEKNIKITTPNDLVLAEKYLKEARK